MTVIFAAWGAVVLSGGLNDPAGGSAGFRGKMRV